MTVAGLPVAEKKLSAEEWEQLRHRTARAVKKARTRAINTEEDVFFGVVGMTLNLIVCTSYMGRAVDTCATDGKNLFVNPFYFMGLPDEEEQYTVYLHEVLHVTLMHHLRRGGRDFWWWNVSTDHAINLILEEKNRSLSNWLCNKKYRGWSAERVYRDVYVEPDPIPEPTEIEEEESDEDIECDPEDAQSEDEYGEDGDEPGGNEGDEENDEPGESGGGSGGNPKEPTEEDAPSEQGGAATDGGQPHGEVWDGTNDDGSEMNEEQIEEAQKELAEGLNEAREVARQAGDGGSASFRKQIDEVIVPSPDWKTLFSEFWNTDGDPINETWSRFNRRMASFDIWMPGMDKDGVDHIVIFDDRSMSVGVAESKAFYAHTQMLREEVSVSKITIVPFNHVILQSAIVELGPEDILPDHISSGGGTNFDACFNWLARQDEMPDKVIVLTDLGDTVTVDPPDCPVLWASVCPVFDPDGDYGWTNRPPFGDVVEIEVI